MTEAVDWEGEPLPGNPSEDEVGLLVEVIEEYVDAEGLYQLVTYPGVYEVLKEAFQDAVATRRQEYLDLAAEETEEATDGHTD